MNIRKFYMADTGAAGSAAGTPSVPAAPGTGSASSPRPGPGAAPPSAPATVPAAQPAAGADAEPAWAKALATRLDAIEGTKAKLEADKGAAETKAKTADERFAALETESKKTRIDAALDKHIPRYKFADAKAEAQARKLFEAEHKLEVKDGAVLAYGADGKPQHVDMALDGWLKTEGKYFLASPLTPGSNAPPSSTPAGAPQQKLDVKNMPRAEFQEHLRKGTFTGVPLTNDPRAPKISFRNREVPALVERRNQMLGRK